MITKAENDITLVRVNDGEAGPPGADGYSPSVSTGTSQDGSTTLTVTDKDGSTTTTLQDGIARVDAANAQTTAQEAESKADDVAENLNNKLDVENNESNISWDDGTLTISSQSANSYYSTEVGGDGISFNYGTDKTNAKEVASIDHETLVINKTVMFKELRIGDWILLVNSNDTDINKNSLILKWGGN